MDFTKFQPKNGEKYIFVENGRAVAVLLSFEDYEKNFQQEKQKALPTFTFRPALTKQNGGTEEQGNESAEKELRVEDLPF